MQVPLFRAVWATALIFGAMVRLSGQTPDSASAPPASTSVASTELGFHLPVQLDEFNVEAARLELDTEHWYYARVEGIEVISSATEGRTKWLAEELQRLTFALDQVAPGLRPRKSGPLAIIICRREDEFSRLRPKIASDEDRIADTVGFRNAHKALLLINQRPTLPWPEIDAGPDDINARLLYRESSQRLQYDLLYYLFLDFQQPELPVWLREGLARIYSNIRITDESMSVGRLGGGGAITGTPDSRYFNAALVENQLLPMQTLFDSRPSGRPSTDASLKIISRSEPAAATWATQCEAFVHWGLYGDLGRHEKQFQRFVSRLRREPLSEALFQECFQLSFKDALFALRAHIDNTRSKYDGVRSGKGQKIQFPPHPQVRDATPAEVARLKACAHALAGRPEEARTILVRAYKKGEREPDLLADLGLSDLDLGEKDRARQFLEVAAARRSRVPRAYVELARLRFAEVLARRSHAEEKLLPHQVRSVIDPLGIALTLQPQAAAYALAAEVWSLSDTLPNAEQFEGLKVGVKLDPRNHDLLYRVASLATEAGFVADARTLIELGEKTARDDIQRSRFVALAARLPKKTS